MAPRWQHLARLDEIPVGESKGFDLHGEGRDSLFVVRTGEASVVAYQNACPHVAGARMAWKKDRFMSSDGRHITCFGHGALFRPEDGFCVSGPCQGQYLATVEIAIREGELHLRLDELAN
ncbi:MULTISPECIES: Rieske 2Fe-2S domain-containing protein [Salinicola]|uniref:Rieske (2Fe-2S) protein n=1 Tax=Salinicola TaxID=404432 RepID=UPI0018E54EEB|nr:MULTISPECIES: Rieske 2Fe-2S domain-containing protein [Salinicola]